jgi:hypothetical protein
MFDNEMNKFAAPENENPFAPKDEEGEDEDEDEEDEEEEEDEDEDEEPASDEAK